MIRLCPHQCQSPVGDILSRGLIHPIDFDHPANPPSNPELPATATNSSPAIRIRFPARYCSRAYRGREPARVVRWSPPAARLSAHSRTTGLQLDAGDGHTAEWKAQGAGHGSHRSYKLANTRPSSRLRRTPGQPEGQSFQATLDQALLLRNGGTLRNWLAPRAGDLADRLGKLTDDRALADELFLSVLTRLPTEDERQTVSLCLKERPKERPAALQDLAWALVNSVEFRFNH